MLQILNLEGQLKTLHKAHEGSKLNLTQAIEACNFATKKRRAAERQLAKLQVPLSSLTLLDKCAPSVLIWLSDSACKEAFYAQQLLAYDAHDATK